MVKDAMPTFFEENTLTAEQKTRWDWAVAEYEKVLGATIKGYSKGDPLARLMGYEAGHCKSALFSRLLNGKAALKLRPPTAYSYPWYSVIEEDKPHHVMVDFDEDGSVLISQCHWKMVKEISSRSVYRLTYPGWEELGFEWELRRIRLPASETESFICCWHDKNKPRITTVAELKAEAAWHVREKVRKMRQAVEGGNDAADPVELVPGYDKLLAAIDTQEVEYMQSLVAERVSQGKSALPDQAEIDAEIDERYRAYLSPDESVSQHEEGEDGLLYTYIWQLERVTPNVVGKDIYFDHAPYLVVVNS